MRGAGRGRFVGVFIFNVLLPNSSQTYFQSRMSEGESGRYIP